MIAALLIALSFQLGLTPQHIEEDAGVNDLVKRYSNAQRANDAAKVAALYAFDGMVIPSDERSYRGHVRIEALWRREMQFRTNFAGVVVSEVKIGEDSAYVVGSLFVRPTESRRFVLVLERLVKKESSIGKPDWVIAADIWSHTVMAGFQPAPGH